VVLPGELLTTKEDDPKIEIVPLTDEIRDRMKLRGTAPRGGCLDGWTG